MTNYESIPYSDKDKFAEWLSQFGCIEDLPWIKWLDTTYCQTCEPVVCHYEDGAREILCSPCELDGCPYGVGIDDINDIGLITLWLNTEYKEEPNV